MRPVSHPAFPLALFDEPDDATRWIGGWLKKIVVPHRAAGAPPLERARRASLALRRRERAGMPPRELLLLGGRALGEGGARGRRQRRLPRFVE